MYNYTIIIEKDVNSISEFQTWMTAPILVTTAATVIVAKRKLDKKSITTARNPNFS